MEIQVAIFEDNKFVRDALEAILNATPGYNCIATFSNGDNWKNNMAKSHPDVVLMDIEMPGMDGICLTKEINAVYPEIKILIQTVFDESEKIFTALCAGASGYILKNDSPQKYLEAIKDVYDGKASINASIAKKVVGFFTNKNIIMAMPLNKDFKLTTRELEILKHIATGKSLKNIAESLFISYDTIRSHSKNIYKKLEVASKSEAAMKAFQQGIL